MRNRIRHYRRQLGLTQTELAKKLGTTAATVSRLETEGIKISVDWLQPLATLLQVQMTELIDEPSPDRIETLGTIDANGMLLPSKPGAGTSFLFKIPALHPVAATVGCDLGPYRAGEIIIGDRLESLQFEQAMERICFVALPDEHVLVSRIVPGMKKTKPYALVSLSAGEKTRYVEHLAWCAPIIMAIRYF